MSLGHALLSIATLFAGFVAQDEELAKDARGSNYDRASRAIEQLDPGSASGLAGLLSALGNRHHYARIEALRRLDQIPAIPKSAFRAMGEMLEEHRPFAAIELERSGLALLGEQLRAPMVLNLPSLSSLDGKRRKEKKRVPPEMDDPALSSRVIGLQTLARWSARDWDGMEQLIAALPEPHGMDLTAYSDLRLAWAQALTHRDDASKVKIASSRLDSDDPHEQALGLAASFAFGKVFDKDVSARVVELASGTPPIRFRAMSLFHRLEPTTPGLRDALLQNLERDELALRVMAMRRLLQVFGEEPEGAIALAIEGMHAPKRIIVAYSLGIAGLIDSPGEELIAELKRATASKDKLLAIRAIRSLGRHGPLAKSTLATLRKRTRHRDKDIQEAAEKAIEQIKGSPGG